ncbi:MAG: hypothetical protein ACI9A1_001179 [Lentimonas sp.]|jgi:hypothetical protein
MAITVEQVVWEAIVIPCCVKMSVKRLSSKLKLWLAYERIRAGAALARLLQRLYDVLMHSRVGEHSMMQERRHDVVVVCDLPV